MGNLAASTGLEREDEPSAPSPQVASLLWDELSEGLPVRVRSLGRDGHIIQARSEREVLVGVGPLKLTVSLGDLAKAESASPPGNKQSPVKSNRKPKKKKHVPVAPSNVPDYESPPPRTDNITVDLRGVRRDEVADILLPALDRAYLNNWEALWVIHGHGTGAVREEVRQLLRSSPYPRHSRAGLRHEGGNGVTIVWLDNR